MFIVKCNTTFLKPSLKKAAVVFMVAFFSVSTYGQKKYFAYDPKIPKWFPGLYYGPTSDSHFLYGTSQTKYSDPKKPLSQNIYLYRLEDHSSTHLAHHEVSTRLDSTGSSAIEFIEAKNKTYIISAGSLFITDGTPSGTKLLKSFGIRYCCGPNGSDLSRISPLFVDNDDLYFTYEDSLNTEYAGRDRPSSVSLWKTNGTQSGTRQISKSISEKYPYTYNFIGNAFINYSFDPNTLFYFSKGGLWKSSQNNRPFITLDDDLTASVIDSQTVTTSRGNFMCGLNYNKTGNALWRFSNSGNFEIIADGCDAIINTFDNRVFYTVNNQIWETDGTSLGERRLINFRGYEYENGISSCKAGNNLFIGMRKSNSTKNQFIKIGENGIFEDLSAIVNPHLGSRIEISCIKNKVLLRPALNNDRFLTFNLKNAELGRVLNDEPKQLRNTKANYILAQNFRSYRRWWLHRPFLLLETAPNQPNLGALLLLLDED